MNNRIEKFAFENGILQPEQLGFVKGNRTSDCLNILHALNQYYQLTKKRLNLLIQANEVLKSYPDCFAFSDVNCRTRIKIGDDFSSFNSVDELEELIVKMNDSTRVPVDHQRAV